jgi:hypothetical protein
MADGANPSCGLLIRVVSHFYRVFGLNPHFLS